LVGFGGVLGWGGGGGGLWGRQNNYSLSLDAGRYECPGTAEKIDRGEKKAVRAVHQTDVGERGRTKET